MRAVLVVLTALFVSVWGQTTNSQECILTRVPRPLHVYVSGCTDPPCRLPQLQNAVVNVVFRSPRNIIRMTTLATAILNVGVEVSLPYPLGENAVTCNFFTNTFCPILKGEVVQYRIQMFIESFFPVDTLATVEFRVVDNDRNNEPIWCIRLPIHIRPPVAAIADASAEDANSIPSP